jgi:hypothetical protein
LAVEQGAGDLSWLDELEANYSLPALPDTTTSGDFVPGSGLADTDQVQVGALPAWLSQAVARDEPSDVLPAQEGEEELSPTDLPGWLKAMRPVGVVGAAGGVTGEAIGPIEGAGPLAGLRNVLPAEPEVTQTEKPAPYSLKLQVTEIQQAHADLLKGLVDAEAQARPVPAKPVITTQHVLRIAMTLLIILPVVISLLTGSPMAGIPEAIPEVDATAQLINNLSPGVPVILAVDYDPGWSGEMDTLTRAVINQLLARGVFLVLVSTVPTGPVQAEHLLTQVESSRGIAIEANQQYVNLGYIPGGAAGLLGFATVPRQTVGGEAWQLPSLQNVTSLAHFGMVLVATQDIDTARLWIEQVSPGLGNIPLVMLVSAQAAPIIQAYYNAGPSQIQGLVSGLAGAARFEWVTVQNGPAIAYWGPFTVGMLMAGVMIVMGGIFNVASTRVLSRKAKADRHGEAGSEVQR